MNERVTSVLELVGRTPLVRLGRVSPEGGGVVWGKLEAKNPGGSVKDRPALRMIEEAERAGKLGPGAVIVEATSGNTGISLAMIAAVRGYRCVLVMPEDMSMERRYVLRAYGADIELTPAELRVLMALVEIGGVPEVAPVLGIAETTVRTHLRHLFEKTGTSRQADLVKIVAGFASPLVG